MSQHETDPASVADTTRFFFSRVVALMIFSTFKYNDVEGPTKVVNALIHPNE